MATYEDELKDLKKKNNELVQKVQYWKMTADQRENEKLELMKEINDLRLKLIRLKSGSAAEARKLDTALQSASEEALSHLVQASGAVARTIELAKTYMRDRQEFETLSPRWSNISNSTEKVHRVPPMMIGGQSIQPVVSLSRNLNLSGQRSSARSPNSTRNITVRALPMHMLQDVYIPLTRIDTRQLLNNNETEEQEVAADNIEDNIPFDTSMEEAADESQNITDEDDYETSRRLDVIVEEDVGDVATPPRARQENPLEGPSWLLDALGTQREASGSGRRPNFEPDSTTQGEEAGTPPADPPRDSPEASSPVQESPAEPARMFTPTVRRRRRVPSPRAEPARNTLKQLQSDRVLQVLLPKMRLESDASPPKRVMRFDAPSPNGATDSRVIVSEELARASNSRPSIENHKPVGVDDPRARGDNRDNHDISDNRDMQAGDSHRRDSGDSDSSAGRVSEGRTRRNRKPVTYKEKPLNRKLRR